MLLPDILLCLQQVNVQDNKKPLSVAVEELYKSNIHIVRDEETEDETLIEEEIRLEEETPIEGESVQTEE